MSTLERAEQPRQYDAVTLFAVACLASAGFGVAWELVSLARMLTVTGAGRSIGNPGSILANPWNASHVIQIGALIVAGIGLLRRRRWGWWFALGFCAISFGDSITTSVQGVHLGGSVWPEIKGIFAMLGKPFTIALVLFLIMAPSMRAILSRTDGSDEVFVTEPAPRQSASDCQALGWVLLATAVGCSANALATLLAYLRIGALVAENTNAPADFLVRQQPNILFATTIGPLALGEFLLALIAGIGMLRNRPWAHRAAFWFAVLCIGSIVSGLLSNWLTMWPFLLKQPLSRFPANSAAYGAYMVAICIRSLSRVVFPVLLLFLLRSPQIRTYTGTPVPAQAFQTQS